MSNKLRLLISNYEIYSSEDIEARIVKYRAKISSEKDIIIKHRYRFLVFTLETILNTRDQEECLEAIADMQQTQDLPPVIL